MDDFGGNALTPRQRRFVDEYLVDLNATQAAIQAGYSVRTANGQGAHLLFAKASIAAAVQTAQKARGDRPRVTQDDVLLGLQREARLTGPGTSHAARVAAWSWLCRHIGMFVDRSQQLGPVNRRFPQMCSHHLIEPVACTPAAGWEKGQVENQVGNLRDFAVPPQATGEEPGRAERLAGRSMHRLSPANQSSGVQGPDDLGRFPG